MPFVGEIRIFAGNFAPLGWEFCQGQLLSIADNTVLFNLIGTTYGGDGINTFGLPDLQGRMPVHVGMGLTLGQMGGAETVTLTAGQLPPHSHLLEGSVFIQAMGANPGPLLPANNHYPTVANGSLIYSTTIDAAHKLGPMLVSPSTATTMMTVQNTGNGQPKANMQPFAAISFIISMFGIFPSQF